MSKQDIAAERRRRDQKRKKEQRAAAISGTVSLERTPDTNTGKSPKPETGWFSEHAKALFVWASVIASILGGYALLRPSLLIEPDFFRKDREPLSAYFRVRNGGLLDVFGVSFSCFFSGGQFRDVEIQRTADFESAIASGESATKDCPIQGFHPKPDDPVTLLFIVKFRPQFWPREIVKAEQFSAILDANGMFHWAHAPRDIPIPE